MHVRGGPRISGRATFYRNKTFSEIRNLISGKKEQNSRKMSKTQEKRHKTQEKRKKNQEEGTKLPKLTAERGVGWLVAPSRPSLRPTLMNI